MQAVMSCQKLIDRPGAEDSLLRLMHLEMKLVPRPVMKGHGSYEDGRPLPRDRRDKSSDWHSLYRRLTHRQPYLLVFTRSDRLIAEYLGVMLVMHQSVSLKHALDDAIRPLRKFLLCISLLCTWCSKKDITIQEKMNQPPSCRISIRFQRLGGGSLLLLRHVLDPKVEATGMQAEALHVGARRDHLDLVVDEHHRRVLDDQALGFAIELDALGAVAGLPGLDEELVDLGVIVICPVRQRRVLRIEEGVHREIGVF